MAKSMKSPSSRRAWIEICYDIATASETPVALLAEGVDRNKKPKDKTYSKNRSPSSRRAWIEITMLSLIHISEPTRH